ncbi:hypothetical protein ABTE32_23315, partial [Acinetobacter baumannii]
MERNWGVPSRPSVASCQMVNGERVGLAPPHHDQELYPKEANAILFGSPFDPDHPDLERFPLARQAALVCC